MRIRSIKPEFWRSEDVKRLPREIRLLFVGLWSYVDDNGVGVDDYRRIAADLGPLEDDPVEFREYVRDGLARLSRRSPEGFGPPLVARYEVDGKRYIFITGWEHQRVDKPAKSRYPLPPEGWTSEDPDPPEDVAKPSGESRESVAPGTGEQGNRGTGEKDSPTAPRRAPSKTPTGFEEFWSNYPRKVSKADARKAWPAATRKLAPDRLAKAAAYWARLWTDTETPKEFIPYPATWLRGERWDDDPPIRRGTPPRAPTGTGSRRMDKALGYLVPDDPLLAQLGGTPPALTIIEGGQTA